MDDEHAARVVKGWLRAARSKSELRRLWGNLTAYSKALDGVAVLNYELERKLENELRKG